MVMTTNLEDIATEDLAKSSGFVVIIIIKVYLSKAYFCKVYPALNTSSKLCEFIWPPTEGYFCRSDKR